MEITFSHVILSLAAGFLGTVVMTLSQFVEMRLTRRDASFTPAQIVSRIFGINFDSLSESGKVALNYGAHFGYGTMLGLLLPLFLYFVGNDWLAVTLYVLFVWLQGWVVVPVLGKHSWPWYWGTKWVFVDFLHHAVLALATTFFYLYAIQMTLW